MGCGSQSRIQNDVDEPQIQKYRKGYKFDFKKNDKHLAKQPVSKQVKLFQLSLAYSYNDEYITLLNELRNEGRNFNDVEFPLTPSSIGKQGSKQIPDLKSIKWLRPIQFDGWNTINLFQDKIEPDDILQGQLGDCYFLGALGCLAERQYYIQRIFDTDQYNEQGIYSVCLFNQGQLTQLLIDDYFPCDSQTNLPIFSKANGNELWVLLLEKAYAKLYGNYENIVSGYPYQAISDLTGSPYDNHQVNEKNVDEIWEFLNKNHTQGYILTASSIPNEKNNANTLDKEGIVNNHAYSILDVKVVKLKDSQVRLVNLRNPWGNTEWTGDWSDKSDKWTNEAKQQVKFLDSDNGSFWMDVEDLCKYFTDVGANFLHSDYYNNSIEINLSQKQPHINYPAQIVEFTVNNDSTHVYIQFHQVEERHFQNSSKFEYCLVTLCVFQVEYNPSTNKYNVIKYINHTQSFKRDGYVECKLEKGTYFIVVGSDQRCILTKDLVVSTYSYNQIQLKLLDLQSQEIYSFLQEALFLLPLKDDVDEIKNYEEYTLIRCVQTVRFGLVIYLFENKEQSITFIEVLDFKKQNIIDVCPPYDKSQIQFKIMVPSDKKNIFAFVQQSKEINYDYTNYFIESDEILIQQAKEQPLEKNDRNFNGKQYNIYSSTYWFDVGLLLLYENNENFEYKEELNLKFKNLKIVNEDLDINSPLIVSIKPSSIKYFIFHKINFDEEATYNYTWKQINE